MYICTALKFKTYLLDSSFRNTPHVVLSYSGLISNMGHYFISSQHIHNNIMMNYVITYINHIKDTYFE